MDSMIGLLRNCKLRTKILTSFGLILITMLALTLFGGYSLLAQNKSIEYAINQATQRVTAAAHTELAIVKMDRAIQALIAADSGAAIRSAAIGSIRSGAAVDENLTLLQEYLGHRPDVKRLAELMADLRPKQMAVIGAARENDDNKALELAEKIGPSLEEIQNLSIRIVQSSRQDLADSLEQSQRESIDLLKLIGILCVLNILLGVGIALSLTKMMSHPLSLIERAMRSMASGNLADKLDLNAKGKDEIASTVQAIQETMARLRESMARIMGASDTVSRESDEVSRTSEMVRVAGTNLDNAISNIQADTETLHNGFSATSQQLESAATGASEAVSVALDSSEQIISSVKSFEAFRTQMEDTAHQSRGLAAIAEEISGITRTINGISEQTNLLALNAAIEAARAGEQGRGFAVVADEVRTLAGHTSKAVDEISSLIGNITESVHTTVSSMESVLKNAGQNITELQTAADKTNTTSQHITKINDAIYGIVELVESQERTTGSIANAANSLAEISTQNREQSEELRERSDSLNDSSNELKSIVKQFTI